VHGITRIGADRDTAADYRNTVTRRVCGHWAGDSLADG
jgi:hypothetical protein